MLADRLRNFDSSALREAFRQQAELPNPIDLSVGDPEDITDRRIKAAGIAAIRNNFTRYTPANGLPELRGAIATKLSRINSVDATADTVAVVPGLTTGILLVYLALLNPGDEVVVFDPFFPPYVQLAEMLGAKVIKINTYPDFQPKPDLIEAAVTDKTKLIVVNSPNNPSGVIYPKPLLEVIASIADKHNVTVVSDEIYEHFTYGQPHFSIGSIHKQTLTLNGFSKAYGMTGWRIGYVSGPLEIIEGISELLQYTVFSTSSIAQKAALVAIKQSPVLTKEFIKKRDLVIKCIEQKTKLQGGQGAFFALFKPPNKMNDMEFVTLAIAHNLILLPSRAFSSQTSHVRLSYGTDIKTLKKGLLVLEKLL